MSFEDDLRAFFSQPAADEFCADDLCPGCVYCTPPPPNPARNHGEVDIHV